MSLDASNIMINLHTDRKLNVWPPSAAKTTKTVDLTIINNNHTSMLLNSSMSAVESFMFLAFKISLDL